MKHRLGLVAHPIIGLNGAAILIIEESRAILSAGHGLELIVSDKVSFDESGLSDTPRWMLFPRDLPFPTSGGIKYPRYVAGWFKQKLLDQFKKRQMAAMDLDLLFVNSFIFSHEIMLKHLEGRYRKKALIVHESVRHFKIHEKWRFDQALDALDRYDLLIFTAENSRKEWEKTKGPLKKNTVIPNCARESISEPLLRIDKTEMKRRLGIAGNKYLAVHVGNIQPRKGQDIILDHLEEISKIAPNLSLLFIGEIPYPFDGKSTVARIERENRPGVSYIGAKINSMEYIRAADVLMLPSRAEVMPLTVLEAMALGTPVIASDVDGITELIDDGVNGFTFPLDDPARMVACFEKLYRSSELREDFAAKALAKYRGRFSRERMAEAYRKVVAEMLS